MKEYIENVEKLLDEYYEMGIGPIHISMNGWFMLWLLRWVIVLLFLMYTLCHFI